MRVGSLIGFWSLAFALGGCTGKSESDDEGPTLRQACLDSCDLATSCQPLPQDCDTTCETIERVYTGACASAATTLFECEATLSCSELAAYAEDYRSSPCGNEYDAFASACGYQPTPPAECEAFCANAELCAPDITVGTCAENCNVVLASFEASNGAACAGAFLDVYGCYGTIDCAAMTALLQSQTPPAACDEVTNTASVCN